MSVIVSGKKATLTCEKCLASRVVFVSQLTRYKCLDNYMCRKCWNLIRSDITDNRNSTYSKGTNVQCTGCGTQNIFPCGRFESLNISKEQYKCFKCSQKRNSHNRSARAARKSTKVIIRCPVCNITRIRKPGHGIHGTGSSLVLCKKCARMGCRSSAWAGGKVSVKCPDCGVVRKYSRYNASCKMNSASQGRCVSCYRNNPPIGEASSTWRGGKSFEPYPISWTNKLKRDIRNRDNHKCAVCGIQQGRRKFPVHHIDYDKSNVNPMNLITLCMCCHAKTNFSRLQWKAFLQYVIRKKSLEWPSHRKLT